MTIPHFQQELLADIRNRRCHDIQVTVHQLARNYGTSPDKVMRVLQALAGNRSIRLTAFDGKRVRTWGQWQNPVAFFFNQADGGYFRISLRH